VVHVAVRRDTKHVGAAVLNLLLGVGLLWLAGYAATCLVVAAVVDESGLTVRGVLRTRRIRWSDVDAIALRYEPKAEQRRRSKMILRLIVPLLPRDDSIRVVDGDPVDARELRASCDAAATVLDGTGAKAAFFPGYMGWAFFDALRAAAEARGIDVRRDQGPTHWPA